MLLENLIGEKYGRLTVIEWMPNNGRRTMWKCECECGRTTIVRAENLKSGNTLSCGCYGREQALKKLTKHGMSNTKLSGVLNAMKQRCFNPNNHEYNLYGGRGIKICDSWLKDSSSFYDWALSNGYENGLTIDRVNTNGDYCPENCRWVDFYAQANNTRKNIYINYNGETHTLKEWSRILNINYWTLYNRYVKLGWELEDVFDKHKRINQFG